MLRISWLALVLTAWTSVSIGMTATGDARLALDDREGLNLNSSVRESDVAPRILITFPAGNSSVGAWLDHVSHSAVWMQRGMPQPVLDNDEKGRPPRGVATDMGVVVAELRVRTSVLSRSHGALDFQVRNEALAEVAAPFRTASRALIWARERLNGAPGVRLSISDADESNAAPPWRAVHRVVRGATR